MRVSLVVLLAVLAGLTAAPALAQHSHGGSGSSKVYVHGYTRKDGTYVAPHYRNAPGTTSESTKSGSRGLQSPPRTHSSSGESLDRDSHGRIKRNEAAKDRFMRQTGHPHGWPGHVVDHIVPLACGGADDPGNMQWQTTSEAKAKDKVERKGCSR